MAKYDYVIPTHKIAYGEIVQLEDLKVDAQAQRILNEGRAKKIADSFNLAGIGTIEVSQRKNGDQYVIDGQHRKRAAELVGYVELYSNIHYGLDRQAEAMLFLMLNQESMRPAAADEYKVGVAAQLPLFVDIKKVLDAHGLKVGTVSTNQVGAIANVRDATKAYGPDVLDRTFTIAEEAWGRQAESWDGMLLGGIAHFIGRHESDPLYALGGGDEALAVRLAKRGRSWAMRESLNEATSHGLHAAGGSGRPAAAYRVFLAAWNARRKEANKLVVA